MILLGWVWLLKPLGFASRPHVRGGLGMWLLEICKRGFPELCCFAAAASQGFFGGLFSASKWVPNSPCLFCPVCRKASSQNRGGARNGRRY